MQIKKERNEANRFDTRLNENDSNIRYFFLPILSRRKFKGDNLEKDPLILRR